MCSDACGTVESEQSVAICGMRHDDQTNDGAGLHELLVQAELAAKNTFMQLDVERDQGELPSCRLCCLATLCHFCRAWWRLVCSETRSRCCGCPFQIPRAP